MREEGTRRVLTYWQDEGRDEIKWNVDIYFQQEQRVR